MRARRRGHATMLLLAAALVLGMAGAAVAEDDDDEDDEDDWAAARNASCAELVDAYRETVAAERKVVAAIRQAQGGTIAANVLGVATLAIAGVGFFTWDDDQSAEENLEDLRNDLTIIKTVAAEKSCQLPRD